MHQVENENVSLEFFGESSAWFRHTIQQF